MRWRYLGPLHFMHDFDAFVQKIMAIKQHDAWEIKLLRRALARHRRRTAAIFVCGILSAVVIIGAIRALY